MIGAEERAGAWAERQGVGRGWAGLSGGGTGWAGGGGWGLTSYYITSSSVAPYILLYLFKGISLIGGVEMTPQ